MVMQQTKVKCRKESSPHGQVQIKDSEKSGISSFDLHVHGVDTVDTTRVRGSTLARRRGPRPRQSRARSGLLGLLQALPSVGRGEMPSKGDHLSSRLQSPESRRCLGFEDGSIALEQPFGGARKP